MMPWEIYRVKISLLLKSNKMNPHILNYMIPQNLICLKKLTCFFKENLGCSVLFI